MSNFAKPDYEPTAEEIRIFLEDSFPAEELARGLHGTVTIIPAFERYIWRLPVYWGHREVNEDGTIDFSWCVP